MERARDAVETWLEDEMARRLTELRLAAHANEVRGGIPYGGRRFAQSAVARRIGVTRQAVCHWESGANLPRSLSLFAAWAGALGVDLAVLFAQVLAERGSGRLDVFEGPSTAPRGPLDPASPARPSALR